MKVENRGTNNYDLQRMISEFNKKVKQEGIIKEVHLRREYMKPSQKKRWKREEAERKRIREQKKEEKYNKKSNFF